jgi:hypothetical protein
MDDLEIKDKKDYQNLPQQENLFDPINVRIVVFKIN